MWCVHQQSGILQFFSDIDSCDNAPGEWGAPTETTSTSLPQPDRSADFWTSDFGNFIKDLGFLAAWLVGLAGVAFAVMQVTKPGGQSGFGQFFKTLAPFCVVAAFLWRPEWLLTIVAVVIRGIGAFLNLIAGWF